MDDTSTSKTNIPNFDHKSCIHEDNVLIDGQIISLNEQISKRIFCLIQNNVDITNVTDQALKTNISEIISKDYIPYIDKIVKMSIKQSVDKALKEISTIELLNEKIKSAELEKANLEVKKMKLEIESQETQNMANIAVVRKSKVCCGRCGEKLPKSIYQNYCEECEDISYYTKPGKCEHNCYFDEIKPSFDCCETSWDLLYFGQSLFKWK